ncbi:MAG TPA: cupin domain-containing protein, partial [Solirubrobacteraceae bacterium]
MPFNHPSFDVLLRADRSNDSLGITEITVPFGWDGPPLHHHDFDEAFYVLEGQLTFQLDETFTNAGRGELIFAARGERHTLANLSPTTARYLNICTSGAFTHYFEELNATPNDSNQSPEDA